MSRRRSVRRRGDEAAVVETDASMATSTPTAAPAARLQRALGNQALQQALREARHGGRQAGYEAEADRMAREVLAGQRGVAAHPSVEPAAPSPEKRAVAASLGPGQPLPEGPRALYEEQLGVDLRGVRLHTGAAADELARAAGARAFTSGEHVVFAEGENPASAEASSPLLAHELAHVAQQAGDAATPAVQCQLVAPAPANFDALLLELHQWILHASLSTLEPPEISSAMMAIAFGKAPLGSLVITRLAQATWSTVRNVERADSVWRPDGKPEIAVSDDLLRDFQIYRADPDKNTAAGFAVVRTLAHEMRHLNRFKEREAGQRSATIAEKRFEAEAGRLAAATTNKLTLQEYVQLVPGERLHKQTVYPYEEVLARLEEVLFVERELNALKSKPGGATQEDREHIEEVLHTIGYNAQYFLHALRVAGQEGTAKMTAADFETAKQEIEAEITKRYANRSQAPKRLWDLVRANQFVNPYPPQTLEQEAEPKPKGRPGDYLYEKRRIVITILPRVFP